MRKLALHWKIVIGLALGIAVGLVLNAFRAELEGVTTRGGAIGWVADFAVDLTNFVGRLFIRALRFVAVPIVLFSLIVGAASLGDLRKIGRIGGRTVGIYLATTAVAVIIGLFLANAIKPGTFISAEARDRIAGEQRELYEAQVGAPDAQEAKLDFVRQRDLWQQLLDMVPENPFAAIATATMLQVIVAALAVGVALTLIPREKSAPVILFFDAMTDVVVKIVHGIMVLAPYAVFALIVPVVAALGLSALKSLAIYCGTLVLGLALLTLVEYPLLLRTIAGVGYRRFFRAVAPAQLLAFSSSSSSATLPVTMECVHERLGVSEEVTSFVCPLGATINMDGTALYQAVAAVFISQLYGLELTLSQQITILLTAVLASIGTPGIPGAGVVMLIIVLESVGIPPASIAGGIAIILGVDRLMDMCRTVVNVTGDSATAAIVARLEGELLAAETPPANPA